MTAGNRTVKAARNGHRPGVFAELAGSRELLVNLTLREIRGKYKRTVLGQAWSLLNPIAQMATYSVVFSIVLRARPDKGSPSGLDVFALWLSCGLLPWLFFANALSNGMAALVSNANLVQKVYFPRAVLVMSAVFALLFTFLIEMGVLLVAILIFGADPLPYLPATLLAMIILTALGLGLALMLSVANVYFRDTQHFLPILTQIWFYATPIIYPIQSITGPHPRIATYYRLNPLERFSEIFRNTMYDGRWPQWSSMLYVTAWAAVVLVLGFWVFRRHEGRLAEEL